MVIYAPIASTVPGTATVSERLNPSVLPVNVMAPLELIRYLLTNDIVCLLRSLWQNTISYSTKRGLFPESEMKDVRKALSVQKIKE